DERGRDVPVIHTGGFQHDERDAQFAEMVRHGQTPGRVIVELPRRSIMHRDIQDRGTDIDPHIPSRFHSSRSAWRSLAPNLARYGLISALVAVRAPRDRFGGAPTP